MPRKITVSLPDATLRQYLRPHPDVDVVEWDLSGEPPRPRIDIVVPPYMGGPGVLRSLAAVETGLVQGQSIGYDGVAEALPPGRVFANAAGVHETSTAELALALVLASQREFPRQLQNQQEGRWETRSTASLADRKVLLVGYGGVGKAIEDRLLPFETTVTRVASTERAEPRGHVHGITELPALLPEHDIVIVGVPLNHATHHLIDDAFLAAMPDGALLVNVARGPVADTEALIRHTATGRIRAALDVTDPEPLPQDHPLWRTPGVIISPHVGGDTSAMLPRMGRLLQRQIDLMLTGEPPANVVLGG
ncbi:2-hydroxyacid dehydrogenase [Arthrobacter sp. AL08]|uniref:2-hydroxyacid dehydrogenase n=1 Tax=unclassified Arthrobacter TaxID=235627 RepID=UPI00249A24BD|nr:MULTISPECIES: 2-hydroxyacid dehydrogenase [unclassified Arthrobacter]MDI3240243.1 2-hydroxyacid dehydrogenase [Arthrobacter sp. AL05]MDI3276253.1 2-hydroxyacid dehydrogenase [Arthrobacter sp. AL08]